jgi:hypothetical protein
VPASRLLSQPRKNVEGVPGTAGQALRGQRRKLMLEHKPLAPDCRVAENRHLKAHRGSHPQAGERPRPAAGRDGSRTRFQPGITAKFQLIFPCPPYSGKVRNVGRCPCS